MNAVQYSGSTQRTYTCDIFTNTMKRLLSTISFYIYAQREFYRHYDKHSYYKKNEFQ